MKYKRKEDLPRYNEWYHIPGFRGYEIDRFTKQVRSTKHYKSNPWHIMKVHKGGYVYLTDDYGRKNRKCYLEDLWNLTFNTPNYNPIRSYENDLYTGGMKTASRAYECNMDIGLDDLVQGISILDSDD